MDSAAMGSSSMKLDNKRAPYAAGPLRQASRLCIRVTMVRCLADIPEPRIRGVCMIAGGIGCSQQLFRDTPFHARIPPAGICSVTSGQILLRPHEGRQSIPSRAVERLMEAKLTSQTWSIISASIAGVTRKI